MISTQQQQHICQALKCQKIINIIPMQSLWAGQGQLYRLQLLAVDGNRLSLVAKQIAFASSGNHPKGWDSQVSQQRKRRSYQIELHWYRHYAQSVQPWAAVPALMYAQTSAQGILLVLQDLAVDYPVRFSAGQSDRPNQTQIKSCIAWLAQLHARFLQCLSNTGAEGLWPVGGYWQLQTRQDEWQAMPSSELKSAAETLHQKLQASPFQTLIHGDAKLANFCFSTNGEKVAAVDFQYVGKGPGVKDLMLLLSSVLPDQRLLTEAAALVDYYFQQLTAALKQCQPWVNGKEVEAVWRPLYAVAWADFQRFLVGWSPGHWKIGRYCQGQTELALQSC